MTNEARLKIGTSVTVRSLKKNGVVQEISKNGQVRVALGTLSLWCKEDDLIISQTTSKKKKVKENSVTTPTIDKEITIDLHRLTAEEAVAKVESTISSGILEGISKLIIVHGKGSGTLQRAVHQLLGSLKVVKHYKVDEHNAGVTLVYF